MTTASAVSRYLGTQSVRRSEWWPSHAVRGWGTRTSGYSCRGLTLDPGAVRVEHVVGDENRVYTYEQRRNLYEHALSTLARKLERRYDVAHVHCTEYDEKGRYVVGHIIVRDKSR